MNDIELRPCPFCAGERVRAIKRGAGSTTPIALVCSECGARGPRTGHDDPQGHAAFLWNQRFGLLH